MFGFLFGKKGETLKDAKNFLSQAEKVYNYRRDLMPESDCKNYLQLLESAQELILKKQYDAPEFFDLKGKLTALMEKFGGKIYPLATITDYVETIVVAGLLALSVRSFFISPFKIPTNSMYPSFYGMTATVYDKDKHFNIFQKALNWAVYSESQYTLKAPESGNLYIEINPTYGIFAFDYVKKNLLGVWPTASKVYSFYVNGQKTDLKLPADFNFEELMMKAFPLGSDGKSMPSYIEALHNQRKNGNIVEKNGSLWLNLGEVKKGENFLNFAIQGGDMLFVDKFSYNFRKPKVGEPIVFLTKYCEGLTERNGGVPDDRYYIKRLVGQGGDTLKVEGTTLYRNGKPITGSPAFKKNFEKDGLYCGYVADGALKDGNSVEIPPHNYYAMGDNSANSLDSRYWGFVPEKAIVGKSMIIFYPFTSRWGATK